jgi:S1-C subfamily serine protease
MASEPQYAPPPAEEPSSAPAPARRRPGIIVVILISAVVGALVGSGVTLLTIQRLSRSAPAGSIVPPLSINNNRLAQEAAVVAVAAQAGRSVVEIKTRPLTPDTLGQAAPAGTGSGFVVRSDGYIVTNNQVVANAQLLQVVVRDQARPYDARLVGASPDDDIAVLKIDAQNLPALSFADSSQLKVGQLAIAMGGPQGQENSVTQGPVSALHRALQIPDPVTSSQKLIIANAIQTGAAITDVNNGGPLLNAAGQVIGVNLVGPSPVSGAIANYAIDGNAAHDVVNQLLQTGRVNQPYLGVTAFPVDQSTASLYGLSSGAYVQQVAAGSPADKAAIKTGDVITRINGDPVDDSHPLNVLLRQFQPGDQVSVVFIHAGRATTVSIRLGNRP